MSLNEYLKHFQKDHKLEIRCKFCFKNYKNFKFLESHLRKGVKTGGCRTLNSNRNKPSSACASTTGTNYTPKNLQNKQLVVGYYIAIFVLGQGIN